MATEKKEENRADAHPSKAFFVDMLTRDIELQDAILDLIDNCMDGIQRHIKHHAPADADKPYVGFSAELTLTPRGFSIEDNCGGIPRAKAEGEAFRLGRPATVKPEHLPTVGVYGIGMKRAIFKMGRQASVTTVSEGNAFKVSISPEWMINDADWYLPITDIPKTKIPQRLFSKGGTLIEVQNLLPSIRDEFDKQKSRFLETLSGTIATHYSYILHKGFSVKLNGTPVRPKALSLLASPKKATKDSIQPFVYKAKKDAVDVNVIVGLYRDIPSEQEITQELEGKISANRDTCGWTVICNDRVVLYADKSRVTGWGEAGVPSYHPQFNAIAGIVRFQSNDISRLPVTTTKRGLETSSDLYLTVKDVMREGLKHFTNFTNQWKSRGTERNALLQAAESVDPLKAASMVKANQWHEVRKGIGGQKFVPELPKPPSARTASDVTIKFSRPAEQVDAVAELLFETTRVSPAKVGEELFDRSFRRASK